MNQTLRSDVEIDSDDRPVGRILSRREILALFGATGAATLLSACVPGMGGPPSGGTGGGDNSANIAAVATTNANLPPTCIVRPELTEGPLFVEEDLNRVDIRSDPSNGAVSAGTQLDLTFQVTKVGDGGCTSLEGVKVDIWHCDANGIYSDTDQLGMDTVGQKFLRGYQVTDADGIANFTTIYPGWYVGRAVHIHFKMRTDAGYEFTSQLFFDEAVTSEAYQQEPYAARGEPAVKHADDGIFAASSGQTMLSVVKEGTIYKGTFAVGLQL